MDPRPRFTGSAIDPRPEIDIQCRPMADDPDHLAAAQISEPAISLHGVVKRYGSIVAVADRLRYLCNFEVRLTLLLQAAAMLPR
jgi:hypothetical protein